MAPPQTQRPSTLTVWWTAARPHTLTASISPCLVAGAACRPPLTDFVLWLGFCIAVQLGTNLHNDYADFVKGADDDRRVGQKRATAQGWLSPTATCAAATMVLTLALLLGIGLLSTTHQLDNVWTWFWILSSVFNAFAYTAGPYPLGYIGLADCSIAYTGLGDLFVLLYFGLVAVGMLPYLQWCQGALIDWSAIASYGWAVGLLATNIIIVNNLRDRHTDVAAGKRTTAVRFGRAFSLVEYRVCMAGAYLLVFVDAWQSRRVHRLAPLLSLPLAVKEAAAVAAKDGAALNPHVGGAAKVQLVYCLLLSASLWWS